MTRIRRLGLLAVVVAALGAWWLSQRAPARDPVPRTLSAAPASPEDERARLREDVRRLALEAAQLRADRAAAAPTRADTTALANTAGPGTATRSGTRDRPTPEMEAKWMLARAAFLDDALTAQPRDEKWADAIEARTRAMYAGRADIKLVSMKCRSTACRMELSYADARARLAHIQSLADDFADLPRVMYAYPGEPQSHTSAILHMAQMGHPLPQLEYAKFAAAPK